VGLGHSRRQIAAALRRLLLLLAQGRQGQQQDKSQKEESRHTRILSRIVVAGKIDRAAIAR
jgi:hypothetical protein